MNIILKIPKEFEEHYKKDHFKDSLSRLVFDIRFFESEGLYEGLAGNYEFETLEMLAKALEGSIPLTSRVGKLALNSIYGVSATSIYADTDNGLMKGDRSIEYLEEDEELSIPKAQFEKFNKSCKKEGDNKWQQ